MTVALVQAFWALIKHLWVGSQLAEEMLKQEPEPATCALFVTKVEPLIKNLSTLTFEISYFSAALIDENLRINSVGGDVLGIISAHDFD